MELRVLFNKGKQKAFLERVKYNLSVSSLRGILQFGFEVPYSTLKGYYHERMSIPKNFFEDLCHVAKISPQTLEIKYIQSNWGQIIGGKKGMYAVQKKYPEEIKKWRKLAMLNSPVIGNANLKKIKIPKLNEKLAEFVGAYLGDGTLTPYQLRIAGDYRYDIPYYNYLSDIIFELFGIYPSIQKDKRLNNTSLLVISSKRVCSFLRDTLGIEYGDKIRNKTVIPKQIIENKNLTIACLRGLIDTDGSVSRRGINGSQFCIQFTNHNPFLLEQVIAIGKELKIFSFSDKTGAGTNNWENIERYFRIVGSSNLKHIIRFDLRSKGINVYRKEIEPYLKKGLYSNLILPFKTKGA
jgi:hypothetical protein